MSGFKRQISGVGCNRSTNWATTTAPGYLNSLWWNLAHFDEKNIGAKDNQNLLPDFPPELKICDQQRKITEHY